MFDLAQASDVFSANPIGAIVPEAPVASSGSSDTITPALWPAGTLHAPVSAEAGAMREERLPFTVTIASDEASLRDAAAMRQSAYGRHLPELAATLSEPEPSDREPGSVVLVARARLDGAVLGTMRIQTNRFAPLHLEDSAPLPDWLGQAGLAEATRLGIVAGPVGRVVKTTLFKAFYQYCLLSGIDWMVITARPPLHRGYEALLFQDVFPGQGLIPMEHVGGIGHRVLALEVAQARPQWQAVGHPLFDFMCLTYHPDLRLGVPQAQDLRPAGASAAMAVQPPAIAPGSTAGAHLRDLSFGADAVGCVAADFSLAV